MMIVAHSLVLAYRNGWTLIYRGMLLVITIDNDLFFLGSWRTCFDMTKINCFHEDISCSWAILFIQSSQVFSIPVEWYSRLTNIYKLNVDESNIDLSACEGLIRDSECVVLLVISVVHFIYGWILEIDSLFECGVPSRL